MHLVGLYPERNFFFKGESCLFKCKLRNYQIKIVLDIDLVLNNNYVIS